MLLSLKSYEDLKRHEHCHSAGPYWLTRIMEYHEGLWSLLRYGEVKDLQSTCLAILQIEMLLRNVTNMATLGGQVEH